MMSMSILLKPRPPLQVPTAVQLLQRPRQELEKVVVVMGATGTGKSRLAIDLATRFSGEIINSDKMQIYKGLDVVTNKITKEESRGVPHHLLSILDPDVDFSASNFCTLATDATMSILHRGRLPIIAGGSNSFIEALVDGKHSKFHSRYHCCFLWVDVSMPVLKSFVSDRVDRMVERGLADEVTKLYKPNSDYSNGIRRSIGVPELDRYLRTINNSPIPDGETKAGLLKEAMDEIKINTFKLACRQRDKINRLKSVKGWRIHRIDATEVFQNRDSEEADKLWEDMVVGPSSMIVSQFLHKDSAEMMTATSVASAAAATL